MDVDESQSLILVVSREKFTHPASIIRIETPPPQVQVYDGACPPPPPVQWFQTDFSAHVPFFPGFPRRRIDWVFSVPPATSPEDLYMLPDWTSYRYQPKNLGSLPGIIFNLSTKKCKLINPPRTPKYRGGYTVTMGDHIYLMAQPNSRSSFERYNTLSSSWDNLEPLPPFNPLSCQGLIVGSAVLDDSILIHTALGKMRAYNVNRNKWYSVKVSNQLCRNIEGQAVVLNNIIYALTRSCRSLVTFTLKSQENNDGDLVYTCDLLKEYVVPGMGDTRFGFHGQDEHRWYNQLVHLGCKDNFCVVRTYSQMPYEECAVVSQYIQLTYIEVSEKKSFVTNDCVHEFKIPCGDFLETIRCFSMPNCKANAIREATRLINPEYEDEDKDDVEVVTLPPELPQIVEKYSLQRNTIAEQDFEQGGSVHADTNKSSASVVSVSATKPSTVHFPQVSALSKAITISATKALRFTPSKASTISATKASTLDDVAASGRSNTYEDGYFISVGNLPLDFRFGELVKKFGRIKSVTFHPDFSHMMECRVADVEFESSTAKQNAIKEGSLLTIGGRTVVIKEKKGTGLARGDSIGTSGWQFLPAKIKFIFVILLVHQLNKAFQQQLPRIEQ